MAIVQWFYLVRVLRMVDVHCDEIHASLLLPVFIDLGNGIQFEKARLVPRDEKVEDEGFAVNRE